MWVRPWGPARTPRAWSLCTRPRPKGRPLRGHYGSFPPLNQGQAAARLPSGSALRVEPRAPLSQCLAPSGGYHRSLNKGAIPPLRWRKDREFFSIWAQLPFTADPLSSPTRQALGEGASDRTMSIFLVDPFRFSELAYLCGSSLRQVQVEHRVSSPQRRNPPPQLEKTGALFSDSRPKTLKVVCYGTRVANLSGLIQRGSGCDSPSPRHCALPS